MRAGFVFAIDDAGKPHILQPDEPLVWGIDTDALRREMSELGWPDAELAHFLRWGVSDYSDGTPLGVATFAPNHQSTIDDGMAAMYEATLLKEVERGWTRDGRDIPYVIPTLVRPGGARRKPPSDEDPEGSSRNLADATWPKKGTPWASGAMPMACCGSFRRTTTRMLTPFPTSFGRQSKPTARRQRYSESQRDAQASGCSEASSICQNGSDSCVYRRANITNSA